ncbi:hypothetical protein [Streptomyces sp. NPDC047525]|uniref:hypothetical protein n=1 Tax=Streptomyces sp. NPDC047525 TaxID=3155264 RepID=UPI0033C04315
MADHTPRQLFELKPYTPPKPAGLSLSLKVVVSGLLLLVLFLVGQFNGNDAQGEQHTDRSTTTQTRP